MGSTLLFSLESGGDLCFDPNWVRLWRLYYHHVSYAERQQIMASIEEGRADIWLLAGVLFSYTMLNTSTCANLRPDVAWLQHFEVDGKVWS